MLLAPYVRLHILVKVTEWSPIGKIAAHSAYEMFSWYKYLIVSCFFFPPCFWSGSLFLIAPFPDLYLLVLSFVLLHTTRALSTGVITGMTVTLYY